MAPDTLPCRAPFPAVRQAGADAAEFDVVVIHETNGPKYFEALLHLQRTGRIRSLDFYETSVLWKFAHSLLRERKSVRAAARQSLRNLRFRLTCRTLRRRVIVLGVAPWDIRLLFYAKLRHANRLVCHTSWPQWDGPVPRRYGKLTPWVRRAWLRILRDRNVVLAAATSLSAESATRATDGKSAIPITHVVSDAFFRERARHAIPFRLLFLGELSDKKGIPDLQAADGFAEGRARHPRPGGRRTAPRRGGRTRRTARLHLARARPGSPGAGAHRRTLPPPGFAIGPDRTLGGAVRHVAHRGHGERGTLRRLRPYRAALHHHPRGGRDCPARACAGAGSRMNRTLIHDPAVWERLSNKRRGNRPPLLPRRDRRPMGTPAERR